MTPDEADQRLFLSKQTLIRYSHMTTAGLDPTPGTLVLVHDEIAILEGIADEHPGKTGKVIAIVVEWFRFRDRLRAKLN